MIGFLLRVAGLLVVYLLVLTSLAPGDILVGSLLAIAIVAATRPRDRPLHVGVLARADDELSGLHAPRHQRSRSRRRCRTSGGRPPASR